MNCHSARLLLIPLVCALMAQHCCSFPEVQLKRTLEQLALPRVTCYVRRIKAVFGPMVKSNIHVKGKNLLKYPNATSVAKRLVIIKVNKLYDLFISNICSVPSTTSTTFCFVVHCCLLRHHRGHNPCASF